LIIAADAVNGPRDAVSIQQHEPVPPFLDPVGFGIEYVHRQAFEVKPSDTGVTIDASYSGNWYDPTQSGHGFLVEALPDNRFYATWYVFDDNGRPFFLQGVGTPIGDTLILNMVSSRSTGFPVGDGQPIAVPFGRVTLTFTGPDAGYASWLPVAVGFQPGTMPLVRLTRPAAVADDRPGVGDACLSGIWYDPSHSGYGFNIEVNDIDGSGRVAQVFWYTYQPDGSPLWLAGLAPLNVDGADMNLILIAGDGARFPYAFDHATLERSVWGNVQLRFTDNNRLDVNFSSVLPGYGSGCLTNLQRLTLLDEHECVP
jgi:hypothetical protein